MVSIDGLDRAEVLAALYNNSRPLGLGILHFQPEPMTKEEAAELLKEQSSFDYLKGRLMKIELKEDATEIFEGLYDRDLGAGACARVIDSLRVKTNV